MSLLRLSGSISDPPLRCEWVLINHDQAPVLGEGPLDQVPARVERVQLVIPAAQVLILRASLPPAARRSGASVLAFAVEERTAGEPEGNFVGWLGSAGSDDVLAVMDKPGLTSWRAALDALGAGSYEIQCEMLMLPRAPAEWSLGWAGHEGFVRTSELEGAATDWGDGNMPPQLLRLKLAEAELRGERPTAIALYTTAPDAAPDVAAWTRELGLQVRLAGPWDWRIAPPGSGVALVQARQRWRNWSGMAARLRPAAIVLGAALLVHGIGLAAEWASLVKEQRALREQMELRFRGVFPDAVAVADPGLQMRRKLAEARHVAGLADSGDFLPMIEPVAVAASELPAGTIRTVSYEGGRMTIELAAVDPTSARRLVSRLQQSALGVDPLPALSATDPAPLVLTVRAP